VLVSQLVLIAFSRKKARNANIVILILEASILLILTNGFFARVLVLLSHQ
jgi:hypothetical protein